MSSINDLIITTYADAPVKTVQSRSITIVNAL